jgi:hypothetical protein
MKGSARHAPIPPIAVGDTSGRFSARSDDSRVAAAAVYASRSRGTSSLQLELELELVPEASAQGGGGLEEVSVVSEPVSLPGPLVGTILYVSSDIFVELQTALRVMGRAVRVANLGEYQRQ